MSTNHTTVWESCLKIIKDNISIQAYKVWFEPIIPTKLENNILTLQVPSHFFYEWLEQHYIQLLKKVIKKEDMIYCYQLKIIQLGLLRQGLTFNILLLEVQRLKTS